MQAESDTRHLLGLLQENGKRIGTRFLGAGVDRIGELEHADGTYGFA